MPHPLIIFSQSYYLIQIFVINLHIWWQTVQIQISWLHQKPTDLDLHCLLRQSMSCSAREGLIKKTIQIFPKMLSSKPLKGSLYSCNHVTTEGLLHMKIYALFVSWLYCLALWVKFSADNILKYFSFVSQKTGFDISCKLSPMETICIKCQIQFFGKNKKNIINLLSAECDHRVVKVINYFSNTVERGQKVTSK